jgi:hypothetical protein
MVKELRRCLAEYNSAVGMAKVAKASVLMAVLVDAVCKLLEGRENGI